MAIRLFQMRIRIRKIRMRTADNEHTSYYKSFSDCKSEKHGQILQTFTHEGKSTKKRE